MLKLTYLYHSGFLLESERAYVVFDYFLDGQAPLGAVKAVGVLPRVGSYHSDDVLLKYKPRGVSDLDTSSSGVLCELFAHLDKPCYFLSSHVHNDHFNPFVLRFFDYVQEQKAQGKAFPEVHFVFSRDIRAKRKKLCMPYVEAGAVSFIKKGERLEFEKDGLSVEAFGSTDIGVSFLVTVDGMHVFHAGDLNEWHWQEESTEQEIEQAKKAYKRELSFIQSQMAGRSGFDVAMFPCDPFMERNFFSGAIALIHAIPTSLLVPMHVWERPEAVLQEKEHTTELQDTPLIAETNTQPPHVPDRGPRVALMQPAIVAEEASQSSGSEALQALQMWLPAFSGAQLEIERI